MALIRKTIDVSQPLTSNQLDMLKKAKQLPKSYDEDNPPLSPDELLKFKRVSEMIEEEKSKTRKQNITLRLSPSTVKKAKSLGKGYTSLLAKIIETALDNPELIESMIK